MSKPNERLPEDVRATDALLREAVADPAARERLEHLLLPCVVLATAGSEDQMPLTLTERVGSAAVGSEGREQQSDG